MSYRLFLDDVRDLTAVYKEEVYRHPLEWVTARNFTSFQEAILNKGLPVFISFDHDLADEHYANPATQHREKTGYDCALWLCDYCLGTKQSLPEYKVHSMNPVGKRRIEALLESFSHSHIK
jgi:hypothetical protein